jgi:NAD(P)-dependent dehydrogenase (short-subunit alcohol dehydrogenase family)
MAPSLQGSVAVITGAESGMGAATVVGEYAAARGISRDDAYAALSAHVPLRGPCEPDEIASACAFLASRDALGITGTSLTVDHGQSALSQGAIPFMVRGLAPQ